MRGPSRVEREMDDAIPADVQRPELPGVELEAILAHSSRSSVLRVVRGGARYVLRLSESSDVLAAEVGVFSRVTDPGLVAPIEWGRTASGRTYVLRPFVEGVPIDAALVRADPTQMALLVQSLLESLAALHDAGLVHRDLKASNVLVSAGRVVLVDLDLLQPTDSAGPAAGSRFHTAPEVLLGQAHRPSADLFSTGVMLAHAFCGEPGPGFDSQFPRASFWRASGLDSARIPACLGPLVRSLVRRHPEDRPPSARDAIGFLPGSTPVRRRVAPLPLLAGRERFPDEVGRALEREHPILIVGVADEHELAAVAEELQLQCALRGRAARCCELGAGLDADALSIEVGPGPLALVLESLRRALVDAEPVALVVPEETAHAASEALVREIFGAERRRVRQLSFPPLRPEPVEVHLRHLAQGSTPTTLHRMAKSLVQRTGGRRLAINALLARAEERGLLRGPTPDWTLVEDQELPIGDVTDEERSRHAALGPEARALLLATALLEQTPSLELLTVAGGLSPAGGCEGFAELQLRGALVPGVGARGGVVSGDPRWLEVARAVATDSARREVYGRAAAALRAQGAPERRVVALELAADEDGSVLERALDLAEGERTDGHLGSARGLAQRVWTRIEGAGDVAPELRARSALVLARLGLSQGSADEARQWLERAFGKELNGAPPAVLLAAAEAEEVAGQRASAGSLYERVLAEEVTRDEELAAIIGVAYGTYLDGAPQAALDRIAGLPEPGDSDHAAGTLLNLRGGALAALGRLDDAHAALDLAMAHARATGDATLIGRTELNRGFALRRAGRLEQAVSVLRRAVDAFESSDHDKLRSLAINNLAVLFRDRGELASARELLAESLRQRRRLGDAHGTVVSLGNLGFVDLDAGQVGAALDRLDQSATLARAGGYEHELGVVEAHRALAHAMAGRVAVARRALAEPAVESLGVAHRGVVARARAMLATLAGERGQAQEALREAIADAPPGERFRVARQWLAYEPEGLDARTHLVAAGKELQSPVREEEAAWLGRAPGAELDSDRLSGWLETFERAGRTDLVRAVAHALAQRLHGAGRRRDRRRAMARADGAADALVDGLVEAERGATLERLNGLSGWRTVDDHGTSLDVDWLLTWNQRLANEQREEELLAATVDTALEVTGARRGFLVLLEDERVDVRVARGLNEDELPEAEIHFSQTVVREALATRRIVSTRDAGRDPRFATAKSIQSLSMRSLLCVPLPAVDGLVGSLYLDGGDGEVLFDDYDIEAARALADQAAIAIANLRRREELEQLNQRLRERITMRDRELIHMQQLLRTRGASPPLGQLVGESPSMRTLLDGIARFAPTSLPVLVTGPQGSEIRRVARALHESGPRSSGPFLTLNLAAVAAHEIGAELFGREAESHEVRSRHGCLARAHGGTLFLDGVEALPMEVQPALLDALERGVVRVWGGGGERPADVRIVSTPRADLSACVSRGTLLPELFHTLASVELEVPSLADRVEDVARIAEQRLDELNREHGTQKRFAPPVLAALARRPWPGEVRELVGEVARLYHLSGDEIDCVERIRPPGLAGRSFDPMPGSFLLEDVERVAVARALEATNNNKERAAKLLGISRAGLYKKLTRLGLAGRS